MMDRYDNIDLDKETNINTTNPNSPYYEEYEEDDCFMDLDTPVDVTVYEVLEQNELVIVLETNSSIDYIHQVKFKVSVKESMRLITDSCIGELPLSSIIIGEAPRVGADLHDEWDEKEFERIKDTLHLLASTNEDEPIQVAEKAYTEIGKEFLLDYKNFM